MGLPLAGFEAVLSSDDLQVPSEDAVYDFALRWARQHYSKLEERREVLGSRIVCLIRFPMMSSRKLRKVLNCADFEHELASKLVLEALFFRAEPPHRQRQLALEETLHKRYCERAYKYRPVKVVEFDAPYQQCLVFFDLKIDECRALFPQGRVYSQAFHLGGQGFFLSAHCNLDQQGQCKCFGLFLGMQVCTIFSSFPCLKVWHSKISRMCMSPLLLVVLLLLPRFSIVTLLFPLLAWSKDLSLLILFLTH
jgi:hypothetical protein